MQGFFRMIDRAPEWYIEEGFDYLVFSDYVFGRFYAEPDKYAAEIAQYDAFFDRFELVRVFTDGGYEVRVYRVTPKQGILPAPHWQARLMRCQYQPQ